MNEGNLQHTCTNINGGQRLDTDTNDCDRESRSCPDPPDSDTRTPNETVTQVECSLEVNTQADSGPESVTQSDSSSEEKLNKNVLAESGSEIANPVEFRQEIDNPVESSPEIDKPMESSPEIPNPTKSSPEITNPVESNPEILNPPEFSPEVNVQASSVLEMDSQDCSELKTNTLVGDAGNDTRVDNEPHLSVADKRKEKLKRIYNLRLRKNEARKLNHVEVVEEDKRNKRPANWESRKRKVEWEIAEEEARKQAELDGEDYDRIKMLETSASELERKERKNWKKKNPDRGFSDFAQAQHRQYERLTKQMEPDMVSYKKKKQEMGESFYPGVNTLIHGSKPSEVAVNRMVDDLEKQIEKRSKFSRRRALNEEADVDYINDRNMRFNKKAARFYDQYTTKIKQDLERGTAI